MTILSYLNVTHGNLDKKNSMKILYLILPIVLLGAGCSSAIDKPTSAPTQNTNQATAKPTEASSIKRSTVVLPVKEYAQRSTVKRFGDFVQDRFQGYHVGDDIEFNDQESLNQEIPVVSISDGIVTRVDSISGYGGFLSINHEIDGKTLHANYGHLDLRSTKLKQGDRVAKGQFLANLGDHKSSETDGERKHLHFALYEGTQTRINGYEALSKNVANWINPTAFFISQNLINDSENNPDLESER